MDFEWTESIYSIMYIYLHVCEIYKVETLLFGHLLYVTQV